MLLVLCNKIDITKQVDRNSIRIQEQLNNRSNTLGFNITNLKVYEGQFIELREYFTATGDFLIWDTDVTGSSVFPESQKFRVGDEIFFDILGAQKKYKLLAINETTKTYTVDPLVFDLPRWSKCGRLIYAWVVMNAPEEERTGCDDYSQSVQVCDFNKLFDRKVVVETFENQYSREIFWRIVYEFCANDTEVFLDGFETPWTNSGTALPMTPESVDRLEGTFSQKTGLGIGTGKRTKTILPKDLSLEKNLRRRQKIALSYWNKISSMKVRIWSGPVDFFEYNISKIWLSREDSRSYDSVVINDFDLKVWNPNISAITFLEFEATATANIPSGWLFFDLLWSTTWWFTIVNAIRGEKKFEDVRVQYKKPSVVVEQFAKLLWDYWYIDYQRDFHYFSKIWTSPSPFSITDTSQNFWDLSIEADITNLRNRQTVRGGEAPEQSLYTQDEISDGEEESYRLDYKPKTLRIYVSTDGGLTYPEKTVGVENLNEFYSPQIVTNATWSLSIATFTIVSHGYSIGNLVRIEWVSPIGYNGQFTITGVTLNTFDVSIPINPWVFTGQGKSSIAFDFIFNFQEKVVRIKNQPKLLSWHILRRTYFPYKPIRVRLKTQSSIDKMKALTGWDGVYDGSVIVDKTILTFSDARIRAQSELDAYANPVVTCEFQTNYDWLHPGQLITIVDPWREVDGKFLIQKISISSRSNDYRSYKVTAQSTLFWIIEFFQLLLKRNDQLIFDVWEIVDVVENQDEEITIQDDRIPTKKPQAFNAGFVEKKWWDFIDEVGSSASISWPVGKYQQRWRIERFGWEVWSVSFSSLTEYTRGRELRVITTLGGVGRSIIASMKRSRGFLKQNTPYKMRIRVKIDGLSNVSLGSQIKMELLEFQNRVGGAILQTRKIFDNLLQEDFFQFSLDFTTNISTNYFELKLSVIEVSATVRVWDRYIYEQATETTTNPALADFSTAS